MSCTLLAGALSLLGGGCATGRTVETSARDVDGIPRVIDGRRVVGHYVSAAAYEHYMDAQLAALDGDHQSALEQLRRAITSDGASAYLRTRMGEEWMALGEPGKARVALDMALKLDPHFAWAHLDLGRLASLGGDQAAAERELKAAVADDPTGEDAYLDLAALYEKRGDHAAADGVYRELAGKVPGSVAAHLHLAERARAGGDLQAAEDELRKAVRLDGNSVEARLQLGLLLFARNRVGEARGELRAAYDRSQHDPRVAEALIHVSVAAGNTSEADSVLDALDAAGGPPSRRLMVGWLLLDRQRADRAEKVARELLDAKSGEKVDSGPPLLLLGSALAAQGRAKEALAALERIPEDSPQYLRARVQLGETLLDEGRVAEAIRDLEAAVSALEAKDGRSGGAAQGSQGSQGSGADDADQLVALLATAHERSGDRKSAFAVLESALAKRPDSSTLIYALADLRDKDGATDRAVELVQRLLEKNPDDAEALNYIGYTWVDHGVHLPEAQKMLERAFNLRPDAGVVADSLGLLYLKLGRLDDAARLLERAARLQPDSAEVLSHLGDLYLKRADKKRAADTFHQALAHKPDDKLRQEIEQQLLLLGSDRVGQR